MVRLLLPPGRAFARQAAHAKPVTLLALSKRPEFTVELQTMTDPEYLGVRFTFDKSVLSI